MASTRVGTGHASGGSANLRALGVLALVALGSAWALAIDPRFVYLLVYAWFGVAYGALLQYGRFCMASAVRDLFAVGVPRMAVGMMIAVALYAVVAAIVTASGFSTFHPNVLGWHVVIGAAIFGFGIVFTGGCASGSLYKAGEGNLNAVLVIVAISFSQALVVSASGWWDGLVPSSWPVSAAAKDMPAELDVTHGWFDLFTAGYIWNLAGKTTAEVFGMGGTLAGIVLANTLLTAIIPVAIVLVVLYARYYRTGYMRRAGKTAPGLGDELVGLWAMCTASKNTAVAGVGLGLLAGLHMWVTGALREHYGIFNFGELLAAMGYRNGLSIQDTVFDPGYWYITTQEAQWGGWVLNKLGLMGTDNIYFGLDNGLPNPLLNAPGFMSVGIILGAAAMALARREFKWKLPSLESALFALVGGTLMGIGARIGMGCNIGAFFATVTNGDPSGWVFLLGMTLGAWAGVKVFAWWIEWTASRNEATAL
ncbi:MAG: YeeE/YedE family protein [Burkholderiaceae bacterium]|nr:YeeE/YedE family protein [Burkholderiaceae bacterium]